MFAAADRFFALWHFAALFFAPSILPSRKKGGSRVPGNPAHTEAS